MKSLQPERRVASPAGEVVYHAFGSGPPLLFVNGLGASWHAFRNQIEHFSGRYRCLVWDYGGVYRDCGAGLGPRSIADHACDARAILDAEDASRAAVLGWSLGVQVALQLFADAPARVAMLLLVGGGARAPWGPRPEAGTIRRLYPFVLELLARAPERLLASLVEASGKSPETFTWARRMGLVGPEIDADLFAEVARNFARLDVDSVIHMLREMSRDDLSGVLTAVDVPTLVVGGDRDPFTPRAALERLVHLIAGAEYLLLPGASHYVLLDHAEHVNLRIDKFFAERGFNPEPRALSLSPR
jgi:pimeloyl-ACP methyl ester carboxylesterase